MLEIKKLGAKNFFHYWINNNSTFEYSASDLVAVVSNNKFILRSVSGRVIFEKEGFSLNQIKVYDINGSAEPFASFEALTQRLIDLGYTAYDISYIEIQDEIDSFQGEIDAKTSKGGYTGTSKDLKDAIDNAIFGELVTYQTLAEFNAVFPVPADGTPFKVANDPNDANNGEWSVVSGLAVQNSKTVENVVEESNTSKGVSGKAVVDVLKPYVDNTKYLSDIDISKNFYTTFNGVDSEINLDTPITLSDDGDSLEFTFYVEDLGTTVANSLSLGFIGQKGTSFSTIGFNQIGDFYVRSNTSAWLTTAGLLSPKVINTPYTIKLVWGASDIKTYLGGVFQRSITKGDFTISNIGSSYNKFKGGCLGLTIVQGGVTTIIENVNLIEDAEIINTGISRVPNTILQVAETFDTSNERDAVNAKQVFDNTISTDYLLASNNLINPILITNSYYDSTNNYFTNNNNWLAIKEVDVIDNTEYTLSGFGSAGFSRVYFFDSSGVFISKIDQPTSTTPLTFTTPATTSYIGINIANAVDIGLDPQNSIYVDTLMLNLGDIALDFEPFEPKINGDKVKLDLDLTSEDNYYEFNTTANAGQPQFIVYVPIGDDRYAGFKLALQYDMSDAVYSDIWRIYNAKLYRLINGTMVSQSLNIITDGESEFVYRAVGKTDHTGGVHGDEILIDVDFYADNYPIDTSSNIPLTKCSTFHYIQNSNLHTTDDITHPIESKHYKLTLFKDSGYTTKNRIKLVEDITFEHIYVGISCIGKSVASKGYNELNNTATFTASNINLLEDDAREYFAYNESNNLSSFTTSVLKNPITDDYDCDMFVWDRTADSKYYRRYRPSGVIPTDTIIECEMKVKFAYN